MSERSDFWDRRILGWEAARYSALAALSPFSWTVRRRMARARELVGGAFAGAGDVLDLGCGSGLLAEAVRPDAGRRYLGVDFSSAAVAAGRARFAGLGDRVRFERRDVLDAAAWSAPVVAALGLLDWLEPSEALGLLARLDARVALVSYTGGTSGLGGALYGRYRGLMDGSVRPLCHDGAAVGAALEAAGYRIQAVLSCTPGDPGRLVVAARAA